MSGPQQVSNVPNLGISRETTWTSPFKGTGLLAWGVIWVVLFAGASFGSTEQLAAAFAWLIFVAVALTYGIQALENLGFRQVGGGTPNKITPRASVTG